MSFNLQRWFKNQYLQENTELEKNVWIDLTDEEKEEFSDEIFDMIDNAYKDIGGNPNYRSVSDVTGNEGSANYTVIDLDDDDDIDAVKVSKQRAGGVKSAAMGHDGSKPAKSAVVNFTSLMLKEPGHYIEVSGRLKDILIAKGVPLVTDGDSIKRLLKGKEIELNGDGTYQRKIGGEVHTKVIMGNPL
tara:strand:+ start:203 stop:766 length:564 start_codon:yes stop_codon:yes gene_type:complete